MSLPAKSAVVATVRAHLQAQYDRITEAALEARGYATDPGSKAESKYDTRSLEAAYLAIGQAGKAEELAAALASFDAFPWPDIRPGDAVAPGALVELDFDGDHVCCLVAPGGGGVTCRCEGLEVIVITTQAPLYHRLAGRRTGDSLTSPDVHILSVG
ncbi:MAG: hypothetical protein KGS60_06180 [Verrucomicrobia bacterium]|nr:hypothetical protein [Verrucomicrobiota bacterium]